MSLEGVEKIRKEWAESDAKRDEGLTVPENVQCMLNISYGHDPVFHKLDIYFPKGTESPLPTIIYFHGGGWCYGDKEVFRHYCLRMAERGFTVVNFSYRLAPENPYPAAVMDCAAVLSWVHGNAGSHFIDRERLFAIGDSSGAQLCHQICTALTNPAYAALCGLEFPEGLHIRACALNCGMYFFPATRLISPVKMEMTGDYLTKDYRRFLPQLKVLRNMTRDFPPAFVMDGAADGLKVMVKPLHWRMKKLGVEHEVHIYGSKKDQGAGHVFHLDCRSGLARLCNDEECAFLLKHI